MKVLEFTVDITASPEKVFRVIGDPHSKLAWVPAIKRVEMHAGHVPGPGARYAAVSGVAGLELVFHEEIIQWEPPRRLAYQGEAGWGCFRATVWAVTGNLRRATQIAAGLGRVVAFGFIF